MLQYNGPCGFENLADMHKDSSKKMTAEQESERHAILFNAIGLEFMEMYNGFDNTNAWIMLLSHLIRRFLPVSYTHLTLPTILLV